MPTLAIAGAGGALFAILHLPLAWMLGAMFACLAASAAGFEVRSPLRLRTPMVVILGLAIGAGFTPAMVDSIQTWWLSLLLIVPYVLLVTAVGALYYRRVGGLDATTALFAAIPGGMGEMIVLSESAGADAGRVAAAQATRILITVSVLPPAFAWFGWIGGPSPVIAAAGALGADDVAQLVLLALVGLAAWRVAARMGLPVPALMGPLAVSAAAHATGITTIRMPYPLVALAQIVIGAVAGCRFGRARPAQLARLVLEAAGYVAIAMAVAVGFALPIAWLTAADAAAALLAFAPAGVNEMSMFALVLGVDAAFVASHQVARVACIVATAPFLAQRLADRRAGPAEAPISSRSETQP